MTGQVLESGHQHDDFAPDEFLADDFGPDDFAPVVDAEDGSKDADAAVGYGPVTVTSLGRVPPAPRHRMGRSPASGAPVHSALRWMTAAVVCLALGASVGAWLRQPPQVSRPVVTSTIERVVTVTSEVVVVEDAWGGVIAPGLVEAAAITPGRYLAVRSDATQACRWHRLAVGPAGRQRVLAEGESIGTTVVTIAKSDDLFWSWGCHWSRDA